MGLLGTSPRNRRSRRRSENETQEEKVLGLVEEVVKLRKMRSKKEKLDLVLNLPSQVHHQSMMSIMAILIKSGSL
ncbi:hypothetical protein ACFX2A_006929 [Malus domestica]